MLYERRPKPDAFSELSCYLEFALEKLKFSSGIVLNISSCNMRDFPDTLFMFSFFPSKVENSCWVVHLVTSFHVSEHLQNLLKWKNPNYWIFSKYLQRFALFLVKVSYWYAGIFSVMVEEQGLWLADEDRSASDDSHHSFKAIGNLPDCRRPP